MKEEKARKIQRIYDWVRIIIIILFILFSYVGLTHAQEKVYAPQLHGILRGKYEYSPDLNASRFEVRNARLSVSGKLPLHSEYKLEVDLCDESAIKMKDAWVSVNPWRTLKISLGQQRMPFSIDAHRNPSAQFFANRSFIAKQVGDVRDVGGMIGYTFATEAGRDLAIINAGVFNGSNINNQQTAWFKSPVYSARIQYFPLPGLALVPSIQHQEIAERKASYTSLDVGAYYKYKGWHLEGEFTRKFYADNAFEACNAINTMIIKRWDLKKTKSFIQAITALGRYDYMGNHSNGKGGFVKDNTGNDTNLLAITDYERHRMTLGSTFSLRNPYFPTDIRVNYEKYWYPNGGAKESEQDKLVCEVMIRF